MDHCVLFFCIVNQQKIQYEYSPSSFQLHFYYRLESILQEMFNVVQVSANESFSFLSVKGRRHLRISFCGYHWHGGRGQFTKKV